MTPAYGGGFGVPTWPDELLRDLTVQVAGRLRLTPDRAFLSLVEDSLHLDFPTSDRFVTVRPGRFTPHVGLEGGGPAYSLFRGVLTLTLFRRQGSDQELRDARRVAAEGTAALADLRALVAAAQQWADGLKLVEPAAVTDFAVNPRAAGDQAWAVCPVGVGVLLRADLSA